MTILVPMGREPRSSRDTGASLGTWLLVLAGGVVVFGLSYVDQFVWALACANPPSHLPACGNRLTLSETAALVALFVPVLVYLAGAAPTLRSGQTRPAKRAFLATAGALITLFVLMFIIG